MQEMIYDVAVIGAGPGWCTSGGFSEPSNAACFGAALREGEF